MGRVKIFMDLKRFFSEEIDYPRRRAVLRGEEFVHAVKVTRHKVGYFLILFGNDGYDYYGKVTDISSDALYAEITERVLNDSETVRPVILYAAVGKDFDTVVQKAVELGVKKIVPFFSERTNIDKVNLPRLKKIVFESSKQCGRSCLAEITAPINFAQAVEEAKNGNAVMFYEFERERKISSAEWDNEQPVNVFIGAEGGFSEAEKQLFIDNGGKTYTLGKRILRVATAVVSALTLILEKLGEA